jgi:hypothetical protein
MLLLGQEKEAFLMPSVNAEGVREQTKIPMHCWNDEIGPEQALKDALSFTNTINAKHIALDEAMRSHFALMLLESLSNPTYEFTCVYCWSVEECVKA